ncbi:MAG: flagellar hook assembly protein FlgD [Thermoleophilia bacterium]|nr:flagellar hook assembly protein FlgD [Thermoleophilia bacterium]
MTYIVQDPNKNTAVEAGKLRMNTTDDLATEQKEMFMKLMIAQLRNQDPSAPMDQKDMMAQIAQMSQVEMMGNMSKSMDSLALSQGTDMIGKFVQYKYQTTDDKGEVVTREATGRVDRIAMKDGQVSMMLSNGGVVKPSAVLAVQTTQLAPTYDELAKLKDSYVRVEMVNSSGNTITQEGRVASVDRRSGVPVLKFDDGRITTVSKVLASQFSPLVTPATPTPTPEPTT